MRNPTRIVSFGLAAGVGLATGPSVAAGLPIEWSDLRPASQNAYATVPPKRATALDRDAAALSHALSGRSVAVTGYLLPFDRDGDRVYAFLLLPWTGACSHTPPPPPNQIVVVYPKTPFTATGVYQPVTVTGRLDLELERTQVLMIDGVRVIQSGYHISKAEVMPAGNVSDGVTVKADNPWPFLRK